LGISAFGGGVLSVYLEINKKKIESEAIHNIILNTSRKHVNYEEDKNKVSIPMNKPYNIHNANICNGIFHISIVK
jgi:hypothetical protein